MLAALVKSLPLLVLAHLTTFVVSCGGGSSDGEDVPAASTSTLPTGNLLNFTSAVKGAGGNQSEMAGWVVTFTERDTGISRVAEIGPAGNYQILNFAQGRAQTLSLLDPTYRYTSALTFPGLTQGTVRQFFKLEGKVMASVVHRGPFATFADMTGIKIEADSAADEDGDGIPNGLEPVAGTKLSLAVEQNVTDTDLDNTINSKDSDIDGDGIPNWFDSDDNGNNIPDIFDPDSDGNGVGDSLETLVDQYFRYIIDYLTVQVVQEVTEEKNVLSVINTLIFTVKVRDGIVPKSVKIIGPDVPMLQNALAIQADQSTGKPSGLPWDRSLLDDGLNEDGSEGDKVYSRKVTLEKGKAIKGGQVLFFSVDMPGDSTNLAWQFPFTIPQVTAAAIKASWDTKTKVITLVGTPFEGVDRVLYSWSVHVFNSAGQKVYSSEPISAQNETHTIPLSIFAVTGEKYTALIAAQSLDRLPGFPSWMIKTPAVELK